jgi:membrane associated rhomboid family serine protease
MEKTNQTVQLLKNVGIFILVMWGVYLINLILPFYDFNNLGLKPRSVSGLIGIILSPLLHANIFHILSNTVPLFVLLFLLFKIYPRNAFGVIAAIVIIGGGLVWLFGRSANHIGASGLIYGLAAFIVASGVFLRKFINVIVAALVVILYGSLIFGVLPTRSYISWEGHLFGALAGVLISYLLFKRNKKAVN